MHKTLKAPRHFNLLPHLAVALLASSSLVRCNCDPAEEFLPAARYQPEVLDFGPVSVAGEKTLNIEVRSVGSAGLTVVDALVDGASDRFRVLVADDLAASLAPGRTSSIAVTYRPCPEAWSGNTLKENFDYNACSGAPDANDLSITDNTAVGSARIPISGQPVQPPTIKVNCPAGAAAMTCNEEMPQMRECNGILFGQVNGGEAPCDLVMEVENNWRLDGQGNAKQVGALEISRIELLVREVNSGRNYTAEDAGFEVLDMSGAPYVPTFDNPFVVKIPDGENKSSESFKLRFRGSVTGTFRGEARDMTGLRLTTNDPDHPIFVVPLTAIGSAPDLTILNDNIINYGPVEQGLTRTSTRTLNNFGDATLTITGMRIESGNPEFVFSTSKGTNFPITLQPNEQMVVSISYTPANTGFDIEKLLIDSNDPEEPTPDFIEIRGGAVPTIKVEPADVLVFQLPPSPRPSPEPPRTECLTISNTGFGDLIIDKLEMLGPDDTRTHSSVDDFSVDGIPACSAANPCDPGITLCPPTDPGCMSSSMQLCFTYANNDISTTDLIAVVLSTNDPANPEYRVVLDAKDEPCFFPTPVITIETARPCMGQPVMVNATLSGPGGVAGGMTTITTYEWSFGFAQPPTPIFMPDGVESTLFIPEKGGLYIINLNLENSCGARSQAPAQEQFIVAETGCN